MTILALDVQPPPPLARALLEFENQFVYPLGADRSFRISHGDDYPRFFRAMGPARCFIAEQANRVVGALGIAIRPLMMPDGTSRPSAYIGDLKVSPGVRGTTVFLRMAMAADAWARPQVVAAYGVVMDGTRASPESYTGRVGIPSFLELGKVVVIRLATKTRDARETVGVATAEQGTECFSALSQGRYAAFGGTPADRSEMQPQWLMHTDGSACGRLEDTRRAKRLIDSDGNEMISAHLANFAWRTPAAGAELIHAARRLAARRGFPALFVAVADQDWPSLEQSLGPIDKVIAPATVYGAGLRQGVAWNINSSEI